MDGLLDVDDILGVLQEAEVDVAASASARGLGPGKKSGLRPGLTPAEGSQKKARKLGKKEALLDQQARSYNASGRSKNEDYFFPLHEAGLQRPSFTGRGAWKTWSPAAILRAGFSFEKSTQRQVASSIEGAGQSHAASCRLVVAEAVMNGQGHGLKRLKECISQEVKSAKLLYAIRNMMFDESTFHLSLGNAVSASYSVLCSHAQVTYRFVGDTIIHDEHIARCPAILSPVMNSATMHAALSAGPAGFAQVLEGNVKYVATLTTSDAHAANVRMLKMVDQELGQNHLFLPTLCLQHRVGNIIEQLTKLLGNLGGNFSISKVLNKGNLLKALHDRVRDYFDEREKFQILPETPPALLDEWCEGQLQARDLIQMCMSFDESDPVRAGTLREAFQRFTNFFAGPWTGLNFCFCPSLALEDFTWPTDQRDSKSKQHVKNAAVSDLAKTLVTDSYGSPSSLRKLCWDTYNARLGGRSECEYRFGLWDLKVFDFELKKWHPMHIVLDMPNGGQLWLGGKAASTQTNVLLENGIGAILAAASNPPVSRDSRVEFLGVMDGTGVAAGDIDQKLLVEKFRRVIKLLSQGIKILISCRNGAHRSSFLLALLLIFLTGLAPYDVYAYLQKLRQIVDLSSMAPESVHSRRGRPNVRPIDALVEMGPKFGDEGSKAMSKLGLAAQNALGFDLESGSRPRLNFLMNPAEFQNLASSLGWRPLSEARWMNWGS
ncbi:unnamed protein product [Symbiodinium natans]|uniref:Tyrosine specific protein phosphatases domain-containing protein n=1 Tax=Symbiodinium natans TaxID=878477 RepID=A0A812KQC6_9DINO|nr:unnamed protein product [Symbiodinium natans]